MHLLGPLGQDTQVDTAHGLHYLTTDELLKLILLIYIETGQLE